MRTSSMPFDSDALRANLASTAQEVVIPERYLPLLAAVEGLHGVRAALADTMGEYFHTFRNADLLVEGFQTTLLRNWPYFERSADRTELLGLLTELVLGLLDSALTRDQFSLLLRSLLVWCAAALDGQHGDGYDEPLGVVAEALARLLPARAAAFLERDALLRNLVERAAGRPALAGRYLGLLRAVLAHFVQVNHQNLVALLPGLQGTPQDKLWTLWTATASQEFRDYDWAVRMWGMHDEAVAKVLNRIDVKRMDVMIGLFMELGFTENEAWIRATIAYHGSLGDRAFFAPFPSLAKRLEGRRMALEILCRKP